MTYLVIYCQFPTMRERKFKSKEEAELFAQSVNGSVIKLKP